MSRPLLLLVDDAPDMAAVVRVLCQRAGVELVHRTTVADGWVALQERLPELLLLDMRLTEERGDALCRQLRAAPDFANLRVALYTSWSLPEDIRAGLEAGADLMFAKDLVVQPDAWRRRLSEILVWTRGRAWANLVACHADRPWILPSSDWLPVYNHALHQALAHRIGSEILRVVLERAVAETFALLNRRDVLSWLRPQDLTLHVEQVPQTADPKSVACLGVSLADQLGCLLGPRDSAFFISALAPVVPGLTETLWS